MKTNILGTEYELNEKTGETMNFWKTTIMDIVIQV